MPVRVVAFAGLVLDPQYLERQGVPTKFATSSPVAIIANRWSTVNEDVAALEDRGHMTCLIPLRWKSTARPHSGFTIKRCSNHRPAPPPHHQPLLPNVFAGPGIEEAQMDWKRTILSRFLSGPALLVAWLNRPGVPLGGGTRQSLPKSRRRGPHELF